jgi:hypothetical protein
LSPAFVLGLLSAYASAFTAVPLPMQAALIFIAGFTRGKLVDKLDAAFGKALDAAAEALLPKGKAKP